MELKRPRPQKQTSFYQQQAASSACTSSRLGMILGWYHLGRQYPHCVLQSFDLFYHKHQ